MAESSMNEDRLGEGITELSENKVNGMIQMVIDMF